MLDVCLKMPSREESRLAALNDKKTNKGNLMLAVLNRLSRAQFVPLQADFQCFDGNASRCPEEII